MFWRNFLLNFKSNLRILGEGVVPQKTEIPITITKKPSSPTCPYQMPKFQYSPNIFRVIKSKKMCLTKHAVQMRVKCVKILFRNHVKS